MTKELGLAKAMLIVGLAFVSVAACSSSPPGSSSQYEATSSRSSPPPTADTTSASLNACAIDEAAMSSATGIPWTGSTQVSDTEGLLCTYSPSGTLPDDNSQPAVIVLTTRIRPPATAGDKVRHRKNLGCVAGTVKEVSRDDGTGIVCTDKINGKPIATVITKNVAVNIASVRVNESLYPALMAEWERQLSTLVVPTLS